MESLPETKWMTRTEIIEELEARGFCCYAHETTDELRQALNLDRLQFDF